MHVLLYFRRLSQLRNTSLPACIILSQERSLHIFSLVFSELEVLSRILGLRSALGIYLSPYGCTGFVSPNKPKRGSLFYEVFSKRTGAPGSSQPDALEGTALTLERGSVRTEARAPLICLSTAECFENVRFNFTLCYLLHRTIRWRMERGNDTSSFRERDRESEVWERGTYTLC